MTWSEIDWEKRTWTLPAERTKQGREHVVPLSARAIAILERQKEYRSGEFVFCGYNRTRLADKSMVSVLKAMNPFVTVHGFRSSFRDHCGDQTDFPREHVEGCLGHLVGDAVENAYRRATALQKRREIMEAWAEYCGAVQ
jgi:integrase